MNTPDKCPKCGAGIRAEWKRETWFECESSIHTPDEIGTPRFVPSPICIERQRDQLAAWKDSAQSIINEWHDTWLALGSPGPMGRSMALCVREHAQQLAGRVKRLEEAVGIALKMREEWVQNEDEGYAGAYYAFVKGRYDDWERILRAKEAKP